MGTILSKKKKIPRIFRGIRYISHEENNLNQQEVEDDVAYPEVFF